MASINCDRCDALADSIWRRRPGSLSNSFWWAASRPFTARSGSQRYYYYAISQPLQNNSALITRCYFSIRFTEFSTHRLRPPAADASVQDPTLSSSVFHSWIFFSSLVFAFIVPFFSKCIQMYSIWFPFLFLFRYFPTAPINKLSPAAQHEFHFTFTCFTWYLLRPSSLKNNIFLIFECKFFLFYSPFPTTSSDSSF